MKILSVKFENINSLKGEHELKFNDSPFTDTGLFAIIGETGAGKSTILDAITLALYGMTYRKDNEKVTKIEELISYGCLEAKSEVVFEVNKKEYLAQWNIRRAKKSGKLQTPIRRLAEWDERSKNIIAEKIKEVNNKVIELTGLDFKRFGKSVMLSQGAFDAFLKAGETERSQLLERITGTEVYSEISKAAYQRNKEEDEKLREIKYQLDGLEILSSEEIENIAKEVEEHSSILKDWDKEIKQLQKDREKYLKIEELNTKLDAINIALSEWKASKDECKEDEDKLKSHRDTSSQHENIRQRKLLVEAFNVIEDEVFILREKINKAEKTTEKEKESLSAAEMDLISFEKEQTDYLNVLNEVELLDNQIENKEKDLAPKKAKWLELNEQKQEEESKKKEENGNLTECENEYKDLASWLKKNKTDVDLTRDLPKVDKPLSLIQEYQEEYQKIDAQIKEGILQSEKQIQSLEKIGVEKKKVEKKFNQFLSDYKDINKEDEKCEKGNDFLQELRDEIEIKSKQLTDLKELSAQIKEYRELLKKSNDLQTELESLNAEEELKIMELFSLEDEYKSLLERQKYKQFNYEQQLALEHYEKHRNDLKEGEECPLCLSTTHPFRNREFTPRPDLAEEELNLINKSVKQFDTYLSNKKIELANIKERKDSLVGDGKKRAGSINEKLEDLLKFESRISSITQQLESDDLTMNYFKIQGEIKRIAEEIQAKKNLGIGLSKLITSIQASKEELSDILSREKELLLKSEQSKTDLNRLDLSKETLESKINNEKKSIQKILIKYGYDKVNIESDILKELRRRETEYEDKEQKFKERKEEKKDLINKLNLIENKIQSLKERQEVLVEEGKIEREAINALWANRILKLAKDLVPDIERKKSRTLLAEKKDKLRVLQRSVETKIREIKEQKGIFSEKEKQLKSTRNKIDTIVQELESFIEEKEISDIEALENTVLDLSEYNNLQEKSDSLKEEKIKIDQQEKTFTEQLAELSKTIDDETPDRETLEAELEELSRNYKERDEQKIQLNFQLTQNTERIKNSETLIKKIDLQRQECKRWEILKDLIGSADGKKFSKFAQGLTLKRLTDLANKHLAHLNQRYIIQKSSELDLELEIIDTYHADSVRSLSTLSGGESFLISLALALGLSDLAGRNANIGSLFIDEGFGTLSDEPLEMAINTLERLQNKGKIIGVISHVPQLKERIGVQIQLEKMGNGFSQMKVVS